MLLTLPIYVEVRREDGQPVHHCWPVFSPVVRAADPHLGLAMSKLGKRLKQHLDRLGSASRHEELAICAFSPELQTHVLKLTLDLRQGLEKCRLLFVTFSALERQIAFSPSLPDQWFEIMPGKKLEDRAREVLTHHFRQQEKSARNKVATRGGATTNRSGSTSAAISLAGQAWVTSIDIEVNTQQASAKGLEKKLASLFDDTKVDGGFELQRVGRCLDWLYPDELQRAIAREREVERLHRLLMGRDLRPVVLVGPRLCGKTTVLHECVRRRVALRGKVYASRRNVWLLSPQRLVSGMMYVGQWEGRIQAILREARKRHHVLYFDDFLGLYHAGISRDASLSIADVIKPFILRREIQVLAEMTPEAWQTLQERDRGLADQFHVLRILPTSDEATLRVMIEVHRQLEGQHRCSFDLGTLPLVLQLHQSYIRDASFPGKSAMFSRHLAQRYAKAPITRSEVTQEFHLKTGLSVILFDDERQLLRENVVEKLRTKIVGQDEAVAAAADVVMVAKARLADPARPLATLLFLGPTGVGKTQCAKALAEVMFSDANRLIRLDMNEFVSRHAVAQLVGTFGEPDGLLTSAVRRQPFAVVLLDEIEKAHPDVFDLLLQVMGEGRLTDALGRTADFSNTVIVMTSNLGTTAGQGSIGLNTDVASHSHNFSKAAENFFRPEFFNRIDRIIPFETLARDQMRRIAELLLGDIFQRDGLVRRRCVLAVEADAMERVVDSGYHPQFGARALKRSIEKQLVQPVAASLAGVKPELPTVIGVYAHPQGITSAVHPLESVEQVEPGRIADLDPAEQLRCIHQFIDRMSDEVEATRPNQASSGGGISPEQVRYYALKEQLHRVRELAGNLHEAIQLAERRNLKTSVAPKSAERVYVRSIHRTVPTQRLLRDIQAAQDIHDYLREAAAAVPRAEQLQQQLIELRHETVLLHSLQTSATAPERVLVLMHPLVPIKGTWLAVLGSRFYSLWQELGYKSERYVRGSSSNIQYGFLLSGPGIWPFARAEAGVHVFCRQHENLVPVQVVVLPAGPGSLSAQVEELYDQRKAWIGDVAAGRVPASDLPWPLGSIVRFQDESGATLDLRTGQSLAQIPTATQWKALILAGLPLPPELEV